mgnify:CR=1 FL=1
MNLVINSNVVAFKDRHGEILLANCAMKVVVAAVRILLEHSVGPNVGPVGIYYEVHGHYQCQSCRSTIDDCCQGEVCKIKAKTK